MSDLVEKGHSSRTGILMFPRELWFVAEGYSNGLFFVLYGVAALIVVHFPRIIIDCHAVCVLPPSTKSSRRQSVTSMVVLVNRAGFRAKT
jgi:hypothetical protein